MPAARRRGGRAASRVASTASGPSRSATAPSSCRTAGFTIALICVAAAALVSGMRCGLAISSVHSRARPRRDAHACSSRRRAATSAALAGGGGATGSASGGSGFSGASRSKSRNCSERRTPPSPSISVWWKRMSNAARPPLSPSMITICQSGRVRSNGSAVEQRREVEQLALVARRREREPAQVVGEVEVGVVDPRRRLQTERRLHPLPEPRHDPAWRAACGARGAPCRGRCRAP